MENLPENANIALPILAVSLLVLAIIGRNILNRIPEEEDFEPGEEEEQEGGSGPEADS